MKTNKTIVRMAALSALVTLGACGSYNDPQPPRAAHDPYQTYKLGTIYDCDQIAVPDIRHNPQNTPTSGLGCAHQSNITAMVADPKDLTQPRILTPADPVARQRVLDEYREGNRTSTAGPAQGAQELIE